MALAALVAANVVSAAFGYLGSFAPADGYDLNVFSGSANWSDVSYYNAGGYGPNAGGGGVTPITPDSGKWKLTSQVGAFFPSAAARNAAVGGAPPYPTTVPPGTVPIYLIGNHFPGRGGDGSNLAFRNDSPAGTGFAEYDYYLDSYDFGGTNPASITSGVVSMQMYHMPNPNEPPNPDGTPAHDKFIQSFKDSSGNIGAQWGYARDNEVYWRAGSSGPWNYTGIYATAADWDGTRMSIDLGNDTFQFEYYDVGSNTWTTLAPAGTALGVAMSDLTRLGWALDDNLSSGIGGKNFFDDAAFTIPEPSTALLAGLGAAALLRRRR
ncbi:MAG: PEP-CTERM sorting domain-containing protein [Phycisphaerae bacterium]